MTSSAGDPLPRRTTTGGWIVPKCECAQCRLNRADAAQRAEKRRQEAGGL